MAAKRTSLKDGGETLPPDFPVSGESRHQRWALSRPAWLFDAGEEKLAEGVAAGLGVSSGGGLVARLGGASGRGEGGGGEGEVNIVKLPTSAMTDAEL